MKKIIKAKQINIPNGYTPRWYQEGLFATDKSRIFLVWPRQIGKDTSCWAFMCKEAAKIPGNYFYVFPTKEDARRSLWEKIIDSGEKLLSFLPDTIITRLSNQEMIIETKTGSIISTIRVVGLDKNPDAIRGITPQGVVFSEFAFSDPDAYKNLIPALRRKGNWLIINSTPNGQNHFYDMREGVKGSDKWFYSEYQALWPERPNYIHIEDPEYFQTLVKEGIMTWDDIEREFGCSFTTGMKGSYYADQIELAKTTKRVGTFCHDARYAVDTFWDIGKTDDTTVWFRQMSGNRIIWMDYYEMSAKSIEFYIEMLLEKGYRYRTHFLPHDASHRVNSTESHDLISTRELAEDYATEIRVSGDWVVLDKLPVQDGINAVRSRFSRYHFDEEKCSLGIKHLQLYHRKWDKHRKVFIKDPVHDKDSHAADAIRMEGIADDDGNWQCNLKPTKVITGIDEFWDI